MTDQEELKHLIENLDKEAATRKENKETLAEIITSLVSRLPEELDLDDVKQFAILSEMTKLLMAREPNPQEEASLIFEAIKPCALKLENISLEPVWNQKAAYFFIHWITDFRRVPEPNNFWRDLGLKREREGILEICKAHVDSLECEMQTTVDAAINFNIKAVSIADWQLFNLSEAEYENLKVFVRAANIDTLQLIGCLDHAEYRERIEDLIMTTDIIHLDMGSLFFLNFTAETLECIGALKVVLQKLESLNLASACINKIDEGWNILIQCFADSPLKRLNLAANNLARVVSADETPPNWHKVSELLSRCKRLHHLDLSHNQLHNLSADQWLLISPILKRLESCNLNDNGLASLKGEAKTNFLNIFSESNLRSICLKSNGYFKELNSESVTFEELLNAFKSSSLREVNLNNNGNLTDLQMQQLYDVISPNLTKPLDMKPHPTLKSAMLYYVQANRSTLFQNLKDVLPQDMIDELDAVGETIKKRVKF